MTETQAPWPYLRLKQAAARLGVPPQALDGLINHVNGPRGVRVPGRSGESVWLINKADVEMIATRVGR